MTHCIRTPRPKLAMAGVLLAVFVLLASAGSARSSHCTPVYYHHCYYPCWPCHPYCEQPDTTALKPLPDHPTPHKLLKHKLTLENKSYSEAYVIVYIRHSDGVYRVYDKTIVKPGSSVESDRYYATDRLYIKTWSRGTPGTGSWDCRCRHLITVEGAASTYNVISCDHTHPKP